MKILTCLRYYCFIGTYSKYTYKVSFPFFLSPHSNFPSYLYFLHFSHNSLSDLSQTLWRPTDFFCFMMSHWGFLADRLSFAFGGRPPCVLMLTLNRAFLHEMQVNLCCCLHGLMGVLQLRNSGGKNGQIMDLEYARI